MRDFDAIRALNSQKRKPMSTIILQVNNPTWQGKPNPIHGKFHMAGGIPWDCYDHDAKRSKYYDTLDEAIQAAIAGGAICVQRPDCSVAFRAE